MRSVTHQVRFNPKKERLSVYGRVKDITILPTEIELVFFMRKGPDISMTDFRVPRIVTSPRMGFEEWQSSQFVEDVRRSFSKAPEKVWVAYLQARQMDNCEVTAATPEMFWSPSTLLWVEGQPF